MAKDKKKKLPKGFVPFKKKGEKKDEKKDTKKGEKKKGFVPFKKKDKKKLDENLLKFVDLMIGENYKEAHKFLEVVIHNKIKKSIAEAAKQDLFPKANIKNPNYFKKQGKKSSK
jgi:hypothetical protein